MKVNEKREEGDDSCLKETWEGLRQKRRYQGYGSRRIGEGKRLGWEKTGGERLPEKQKVDA